MESRFGKQEEPAGIAQIAERFRAQAAAVLSEEKLERAIAVLSHVEDVDDVAALGDLLS